MCEGGGRRGWGRYARLACGPRFPYLSFPDAYVLLGPAWCSLYTIRLPRVESLREPITWCIIHNACYISPATCASSCLLCFSSLVSRVWLLPRRSTRFSRLASIMKTCAARTKILGTNLNKFDLVKMHWNTTGASDRCTLMRILSKVPQTKKIFCTFNYIFVVKTVPLKMVKIAC